LFAVTAPTGCAWTATENLNWLSIDAGASGNGHGLVTYSVAPKTDGGLREGVISIGDTTHGVSQGGIACVFDLQPTFEIFSAAGGAGSFTVAVADGCAWSVSENEDWIRMTGGLTGSGSGVVHYAVDPKDSDGERLGIVKVEGKSHAVRQSGLSSNPDSVGAFSDGRWLLDLNGNDVFDPGIDRDWILGGFGSSEPVTGDWNGDGVEDVGVFNEGFWFLDLDGNGVVDEPPFAFGWSGVTPVVGDWNGDGRDNVGVYSNGFWFLDYDGNYSWDGGTIDKIFGCGGAGVAPLVGDWDGDGADSVAVYSNGFWFFDYDGDTLWDGGTVDRIFGLGWDGAQPVIGDWNGDGRDKAGVFSSGSWFLDNNGNGGWDGVPSDRVFSFGTAGDTPMPGKWQPAFCGSCS